MINHILWASVLAAVSICVGCATQVTPGQSKAAVTTSKAKPPLDKDNYAEAERLAFQIIAEAQSGGALNSTAGKVNVLSVLIGGMGAPKVFYRSFNMFLRDNVGSLTKGGGTVRTEYVFTGFHVFQLWSHAARVKAGEEDAFSSSTKRKCSRIMRTVVDPFFAENAGGRIVLGGHSFGTIEMQCLKELVGKKYGKQAIAAAYALAPVARKLDKDVMVVSARHDFLVSLSDFLYPGKAVKGMAVTVPGLSHIMVHNNPTAREVLAHYFAFVSGNRQSSLSKLPE
jgi:hypothetical protein